MSWRLPSDVNTSSWVSTYTRRRYGNDLLATAWNKLRTDIFNGNTLQSGPTGLLAAVHPKRNVSRIGCCGWESPYYSEIVIDEVWSMLLDKSVRETCSMYTEHVCYIRKYFNV